MLFVHVKATLNYLPINCYAKKDYHTSEPELTTPNNTVLLKALMHTNNLIENLDIKSIFQLLQNQIAKTGELHVIIKEKDQQIFQLQREIEESRIIRANKQYLRDEHSVSSEPQYRWEKPKNTVKPLMNPPTWEPVTTPNNFDILKLTDPPEGQPPRQPKSEDDNFEIQKENIKLRCQVQYLQRRIAQSEKPKQQPRSKQTDNSFHESPHNQNEQQSVVILGDSMINYQDEHKHSSARRIVEVRSFPGVTTVDLLDFFKPSARKKPDVVIVHVGTNDLGNLDENAIARNILEITQLEITQTIKKISPETKVIVSQLIERYDKEELKGMVVFVNEKLRQMFTPDELIDNSNLDRSCIGRMGLHLNKTRNAHLALNFKQALYNV